ncbi:hypothetical protein L208DRAFT_1277750, partial [Tricholoma matsutake]
MPTEGVLPIAPEPNKFFYPKKELSSAPMPTNHVQVPPPLAQLPDGWTYPELPMWTLRKDEQFQSGWIYFSNYIVSQKWLHHERLLAMATPPHTIPSFKDGQFIAEHIPGMVQMVTGIPYMYFLDGNPNCVQTVGCLQMLESLQWYPDFQEIHDMCVWLAKLS